MVSLALSTACPIFLYILKQQEEPNASEGREEEIWIHEHKCTAGSACKQGAGEQHTQKACVVTFYSSWHYATSSLCGLVSPILYKLL